MAKFMTDKYFRVMLLDLQRFCGYGSGVVLPPECVRA